MASSCSMAASPAAAGGSCAHRARQLRTPRTAALLRARRGAPPKLAVPPRPGLAVAMAAVAPEAGEDAPPSGSAPPPPPYVALPGRGEGGAKEGGGTALRDQEWLLSNGAGAFALGTASGEARRRYHGLLVAATLPPVGRVVALASAAAALVLPGGERLPLGPAEVSSFEKHPDRATWTYVAGGWEPLRDFHSLEPGPEPQVKVEAGGGGVAVAVTVGEHTLRMVASCPGGVEFRVDPLAEEVELDIEEARGYDSVDKAPSPGVFLAAAGPDGSIELGLTASLAPCAPPCPGTGAGAGEGGGARAVAEWVAGGGGRGAHLASPSAGVAALAERMAASGALAACGDPSLPARLAAAADDFIVARTDGGEELATVLAGYPWFSDWGRDTMICLPGLMLATGRYEDALSCLRAFARNVSDGMVPNRFDDYGGDPHYNTIDASLWFLVAATEYRAVSGDDAGFAEHLQPACLKVIRGYQYGARYGIRMDTDGLIAGGSPDTQLTWMDAMREGECFTPRHGKAVEICALWCCGLRRVADAVEEASGKRAVARELRAVAYKSERSFQDEFWEPEGPDGPRVADCLVPGGGGWEKSCEVRPNMVIAAALDPSPLSSEQIEQVLAVARESLVTDAGLRTLAPGSPGYRGRFEGGMMERDAAYHNGTSWPWLLGPYCEALVRAGDAAGRGEEARAEARAAVKPLLDGMSGAGGCLGSVAEVFDGDLPQRPQGCPAQAWSVAELIRVLCM